MTSVLFVCLGNICRSPMAQGAMEQAAERSSCTVHCDSAGTGAWHVGNRPDDRAIFAARSQGADISEQRARQICAEDFDRFDLIIALDGSNMEDICAMKPDNCRAEVSLLLDYVEGSEGQAVSDPYYGDQPDFDVAWDEVSAGAAGLCVTLAKRS